MAKYKLIEGGVLDTDTGMSIPAAPGNRHWAEYASWRKEGNTPDPEDPPPPAPTDDELVERSMAATPALWGIIGVLAERFDVTEAQLVAAIKAKHAGRKRDRSVEVLQRLLQ